MDPIPADARCLQRLSTLKLPTLPAGTPFLFKSLTDENIDFAELAAVLENFPSIAAKLISLANSVWSAPAVEISSLEGACARLGFGVVRSTSFALAIAAPFDATRCPSFDAEYFWCSALLTAEAASRLSLAATRADEPEPATARAAGLLSDLGLLWLADRLPDSVEQAFVMAETEAATTLRQALNGILGFDQAKAGARLADAWRLPQPLARPMAHYHAADYRGSQETVVLTVGVAHALVASVLAATPCPAPDGRSAQLGIADERLVDVHRQLEEGLGKTREIARIMV